MDCDRQMLYTDSTILGHVHNYPGSASIPSEGKIVVEKMNIVKRHKRPRREGEKGQRVEVPAAFDASNAMLICPGCGKPTRVSYESANGKKNRVCKKCKKEF